MITNEQFERVRRLSVQLTGIALAERHLELLSSRCRRLKLGDPAEFDALLNRAEAGDPEARQQLIQLITTTYTAFFRHPWHFDIAAECALWSIQRRGKARLWSAAAATGEEPYSLAMALIEITRRDDPPVSILATDVNDRVLEAARKGEYGAPALEPLSPERRARFFAEASGPGRWSIAKTVRQLVEFELLNLDSEAWPFEAPFDVIFCRNVLMYLDTQHRYSILQRMAAAMVPEGILILDPAENLGDAQPLFHPSDRGVYTRR